LPPHYPMLAPNYAAQRSTLGRQMGLGQARAKTAPSREFNSREQGIGSAEQGNRSTRPRLSKCMKIIFVVEYNQQLTPRLNKPVHPLYPARRAGGRDEAFIPGRRLNLYFHRNKGSLPSFSASFSRSRLFLSKPETSFPGKPCTGTAVDELIGPDTHPHGSTGRPGVTRS
jgi:hypothetical protein